MKILVRYINLYNDLHSNYHYSLKEINHTVWQLHKLDIEIKKAFVKWFDKDIQPDLEISNFTFQELCDPKLLNMTPYQAYLFLDWLKKDEKSALKYLSFMQCGTRQTLSADQLDPHVREMLDTKKEQMKSERGTTPEDLNVEI